MKFAKQYLEEVLGFAALVLSIGGSWYSGFRPPVAGDVAFGVASTAAVIAILFFGTSLVRSASAKRLRLMAISATVLLGVTFGAYFVAHHQLVRTDPLTKVDTKVVHGLWFTPKAEGVCAKVSRDRCVALFGATDDPWTEVYPSSSTLSAQALLLVLYTASVVSLAVLVMTLVQAGVRRLARR